MKKNLFTCLSIVAILLTACTDDSTNSLQKEKVQFTFSKVQGDAGSGRTDSSLPEGTALQISLTDGSGNQVLDHHTVAILKFGESYVTEPLELTPGHYTVTDFLIVKDSEVLFATPKRGSPLASIVEKVLPYSFNVGRNQVRNIEMQVVDVTSKKPEDFGYASFNISTISPLQISVFIVKDGKTTLSDAKAKILDGTKVIDEYSLLAKVNLLGFSGEADREYTLVIEKPGYFNYSGTFNYKKMIQELGNKPLSITLKEQQLLVFIISSNGGDEFRLNLGGSGKITIRWDPGSTIIADLPYSFQQDLPEGVYFVEIYGDLDKVTRLDSFGYNSGIQAISGLEHLTGLKEFSPGWFFNDRLDLRNNPNLEVVELTLVSLPEWLELPKEHNINFIGIYLAGRKLTVAEFTELVNNIYDNTSRKNIRNGNFYVVNTEKPAEEIIDKLRSLKNDFGWTITISNDCSEGDECFEINL